MARTLAITPELLVRAYSQGVFPMARSRQGPVDWYSPDPRAVLPLDPPEAFHVPHSLGRRVRSGRYRISFDACFERVMRACAQPRPAQAQTWINEELVRAYGGLHRLGLAHSVEAWEEEKSEERRAKSEFCVKPATPGSASPGEIRDHARAAECESASGARGRLVGGLYGVALGGAFFGESMFSRASDASKVCLVHLVEHLRRRGYVLLDVQLSNPHLEQFGVIELPREEYLRRLRAALGHAVTWGARVGEAG